MPLGSRLIRAIRPLLKNHETVKRTLKAGDTQLAVLRHRLAAQLPVLITPQPRQLTIAVTGRCNLRCIGCRYERDFMLGEQLLPELVFTCLDDARAAGVNTVRFFGGEPLLHPELHRMIEHSTRLGFQTYVTTNGVFLKRRIESLYDAGLRIVTIGFYGVGEEYDAYVQRPRQFAQLDESIRFVRDRYGANIELQLNFVLSRRTCHRKALWSAWEFARQYDMYFPIDLVSYSLPFFVDGFEAGLHFSPSDRDSILDLCTELVSLKLAAPNRFLHSTEFIRSIPDWLIKREGMRVPCDAYEMIWIGADGTIQLCDTHFRLGNLRDNRLRDLLFAAEHKKACRDAFSLNCPNCMCRADSRILKDFASRQAYGANH
jgi:MoaA/NifB/PqqE/SkfB family radical SAM enzyme